jgi:hypothetical protein
VNYCGTDENAEPKEVIWNKPQLNAYKLNIDACYFPNGSGIKVKPLRDQVP